MRFYALIVGIVFAAMSVTPLAFSQILQSPSPDADAGYSDIELKSFAVAAVEVMRIRDAYIPKFEKAASPLEKQQVQQTATQAMAEAVAKEGMTIEKYNEIVGQVKSNPEVAERVRQHLKANE